MYSINGKYFPNIYHAHHRVPIVFARNVEQPIDNGIHARIGASEQKKALLDALVNVKRRFLVQPVPVVHYLSLRSIKIIKNRKLLSHQALIM